MLQRLQKNVVALLLVLVTLVGTMPIPAFAVVEINTNPSVIEMADPIVHGAETVELVAEVVARGDREAKIRFAADTNLEDLTLSTAELRTPVEGPVEAGDTYTYLAEGMFEPDTTYYVMACLLDVEREREPQCSEPAEMVVNDYIPVLDTHLPTQIDEDTWVFHGEVIDDGMSPELSARFVYSTNPEDLEPGFGGTRTPVTGEVYVTGDLIDQEHDVVFDLNTTYYVRVCSVERHRPEEFCGDIEELTPVLDEGVDEVEPEVVDDEVELTCEDCTTVIVSDEETRVAENDNAPAEALTFVHSAWTADIPEATWIWEEDGVGNPAEVETFTFTRSFYWSGEAAGAILDVAADNEYSVVLNGNEVGGDAAANNFALDTQDQYDVLAYLEQGVNTLEIEVVNLAGSSNPEANPAGVLYRLEIDGECACEDESSEEYGVCTAVTTTRFEQGLRKDGTPVLEVRSNPDNALGTAEDNDTINFVALGFGGGIILDFEAQVMNQEGVDLHIFETSFGNPSDAAYPEQARVYGSQDGEDWELLVENDYQDIEVELGDFEWIQYLKIVDTSNPDDFVAAADGYDVDGVMAYQCAPLDEETEEGGEETGGGSGEEEEMGNYIIVETLPVTTEMDGDDELIVFNGRLLEDGLGGRTGLRFEYASDPILLDFSHGERTLVEHGDFETPYNFFAKLAMDVVPSPVYVRACGADRGSEWVCDDPVEYPVETDEEGGEETGGGSNGEGTNEEENTDDGGSSSSSSSSSSTSGGVSGGSSNNGGETGDGTDLVLALTIPATNINPDGAILHGSALSNACGFEAYFEVFEDGVLVNTIGNTLSPAGVSVELHEAVTPGAGDYSFRLVVEDCNGRTTGDLVDFSTISAVALTAPGFGGTGGGSDILSGTGGAVEEAGALDETGTDEELSAADLAAAQVAGSGIDGRGRFWLWILLLILVTMLARSLRDDIRKWQMRRRTATA